MTFEDEKASLITNYKCLSLIFIFILGLSVGIINGVEPGQECGGPLSNTPFTCFMDAINYFRGCTFPADQLNPECIMSSCPQLNGLSPLNNDGSVNEMGLNGIITVLNDCLKNTPTICGITVGSLPMVQLGWTLDQLFPTYLSINGSCILNKNTGAVMNLNQAIFSLPANQKPNGPITLSFTATNITQDPTWNCSMSISSLLLKPLQPVHIDLFNFPEMKALMKIVVNPTVSIDLSGNQPSFSVQHDDSSITLQLYNFVSCIMDLPPILVDLLNLSINTFFKQSKTTVSATNFLSTFATQGIAAAMHSCQ